MFHGSLAFNIAFEKSDRETLSVLESFSGIFINV